MSEKQTKDDVLKLIRLIDRNKDRIFRRFDIFRAIPFSMMSVTLIVLIFWVVLSMFSFGSNVYQVVTLTIVLIGFMINFFLYFERFREEVVVRVNFREIVRICAEKEKFERQRLEDDRPLLKALIKIKARNWEFDLKQIYEFNKDMFIPEKLMERLYE